MEYSLRMDELRFLDFTVTTQNVSQLAAGSPVQNFELSYCGGKLRRPSHGR
jgi:hypothetical protein